MKREFAGARAWLGVAAALAAVALAGSALAPSALAPSALTGHGLPPEAIDWQPARGLAEPWRAMTAVGVHYSPLHLAANLAGLAVVAAFGVVARVPPRLAWAWLAAWPLTQFGLWSNPALAHFGGLSGVLHAGVAVVVVGLLASGTRAQRVVAAMVGVGLLAKVWIEAPWGPPLRHPAAWDIAVAPLAHASGVVFGAVCSGAALAIARARAQARAEARSGHARPAAAAPARHG